MPRTPEFDGPGQFLTPDDLYVPERRPELAEKGENGHRERPVISPGSVLLMYEMSVVSIEQNPQTTNRRQQSEHPDCCFARTWSGRPRA